MRSIRASAFGLGIIASLIIYALIRSAAQLAPPGIAIDLVAAIGGGVVLGLCILALYQRMLHQIAQRFRKTVMPLAGIAPPPLRRDQLADLYQTYDRTITTLIRQDRYRAITDQLLSSDNLAASFRVIVEHAARTLPIDRAALFLRDGAALQPSTQWGFEGVLPAIGQESELWRSIQENRPLLLHNANAPDSEAGLDVAALLALPVVVADKPVGVLVLAHDSDPNTFDEEDLKQARFFAGQTAIAVQHSQISNSARIMHNQIAALHQVAHDFSEDLQIDEILHEVLAAAAALTSSQHGTLLLLDAAGEQVTHRIALNNGNMAPLDMVAKPLMRQGLIGWVAREGRATIVRDTEQDSRWMPSPGLGDIRSAMAAPLLRAGHTLGILTLAHDQAGHYAEDQLQLIETLSAQAAMAIGSAAQHGAPMPGSAGRSVRHTPGASQPALSYTAAVVYANMRGFDSASAALAPDVLVERVLDAYTQAMSEAIRQHSGQIDRCSEAGVLGIFGTPGEQTDAATNAVYAALAMRQAAAQLRARWRAQLGIDIGVAVGVSQGQVIVRPDRRDAIGEAVTWASRIQSLARTGEVLASHSIIEALNGASATLDIETLPPLHISGQATPQHIYHIDRPSGPPLARPNG